MDVVNLKIYQWVITTHPKVVSRYIQCDDEKHFDPIKLNSAVEYYENMKDTHGKLTPLGVYNTNYFHPNYTKRIQIDFGLGKEVSVNAIIGIPTLKQWKAIIIFEGNFITSPFLQTQFTLIYKPANTGIP